MTTVGYYSIDLDPIHGHRKFCWAATITDIMLGFGIIFKKEKNTIKNLKSISTTGRREDLYERLLSYGLDAG